MAKTVDGVVTAYVYDPLGSDESTKQRIALEFSSSALSRRWLHGPNVDESLAFEDYSVNPSPGAGVDYEVFADRVGSVDAVVEVSTGNNVFQADYEAFGKQLIGQETIQQPFGYTGREMDRESGLIYFRARHFDPNVGRFIQVDPSEFFAGDSNLYAYTSNNPTNFNDPSGLIGARLVPVTPSVAEIGALISTAPARVAMAYGPVEAGVMGLANRIAMSIAAAGGGAAIGTELIPLYHGNNKDDQRPQEIYYLVDVSTLTIQKIGIRAQGNTRYNQSCLASRGVTLVVMQRVTGGAGARARALAWEAAHLGFYAGTHQLPWYDPIPPQQINFGC